MKDGRLVIRAEARTRIFVERLKHLYYQDLHHTVMNTSSSTSTDAYPPRLWHCLIVSCRLSERKRGTLGMEAVGILARQSKSVDYLMAALMAMSSYELSTKESIRMP
jgi:hypothetical protein